MISYEPFAKTRKKKGISTYRLIHEYQISSSTIHRLRKGLPITTQTLDDLCKIYNCEVCDIIKYVPDE